MQKEIVLLIVSIAAFASVSTMPAFASNAQVYITNNSTKGCVSICFLPYQVTISAGDTITWTNLDNTTHTATTGTTNYGPVGTFDSGIIEPGKSFTQFFGTAGKYNYFDKNNPRVIGIILVETRKSNHAELTWVNGSLNLSDQFGNTNASISGKSITISKDVYNSGGIDATSITFRLKIKNSTNFLVYDNIVNANIGAKQTVPISFNWLPAKPGTYQLTFDADPSNTIGDTNENNDITHDSLIIFNGTNSEINGTLPEINDNAPGTNYNTTIVPEFGQLAPIILASSVISVIVFSSKRTINR
ncbi:MAG: CARDB domain-containing protein [Nitrosopumilaceae archaeon]